MLQCAEHVVCAVTEDEKGGREELFSMSREMKNKLLALAKEHHVSCEQKNHRYVTKKRKVAEELAHLEKQLYQVPPKSWNKQTDAVNIIAAKNPSEELGFVLRKVLSLVREGYAYREIAVVAGDLSVYRDEISHVFDQAGIPYFIDQKKGLNTHPLIQFVKKALAVLEEKMSYDSVMAFLRNPYVVSDENTFDGDILCEDLDRLDNYLLAGGIERINRWKHPWVMPYDNADEEDLWMGLLL